MCGVVRSKVRVCRINSECGEPGELKVSMYFVEARHSFWCDSCIYVLVVEKHV